MASFHYKAVDESGGTVAGILVADTAAEARARLRERRLLPDRIDRADHASTRLRDCLPGRRQRAAAQVALITRQLAVLLASGVQVVDALGVLGEQCEYPALARILAETREAVNAGEPLADALGAHPEFFDRTYVGMAAAGERSGNLDLVIERLATFLERRRALKAKLGSALIYPSVLVAMVTGLLFFLSGVVIPQIAPLLRANGRPLPFSAWLLFTLGDTVAAYGWVLLLAVALAALSIPWIRRASAGRRTLDALVLRLPLAGKLVRKGLVSRFAMTFSVLLRSGVTVMDALEMLAALSPNTVVAEDIRAIQADVAEGKDVSSHMQRSTVFPPMVAYMVAVGERSGNLSEVLQHVSDSYDREVDVAAQRLLAVLEPALILFMAAVVGFIAASLMTTLLELSSF